LHVPLGSFFNLFAAIQSPFFFLFLRAVFFLCSRVVSCNSRHFLYFLATLFTVFPRCLFLHLFYAGLRHSHSNLLFSRLFFSFFLRAVFVFFSRFFFLHVHTVLAPLFHRFPRCFLAPVSALLIPTFRRYSVVVFSHRFFIVFFCILIYAGFRPSHYNLSPLFSRHLYLHAAFRGVSLLAASCTFRTVFFL
jgi:hypothetical protein